MKKREKILLITDVPPNNMYSGALLTSKICSMIDDYEIVCFCPINRNLKYQTPSKELNFSSFVKVEKPIENFSFFKLGLLNSLLAIAYELFADVFLIPRLKRKIVKFGRKHQVKKVWCILQGQTIIKIAHPVSKKLGAELICQIWDDPSWWYQAKSIPRIVQKRINQYYDNDLSYSKGIGAASAPMADSINKKYGVKALPLISTIPKYKLREPNVSNESKNPFKIGFCGQFYSKEEWKTFFNALDITNWIINERGIKLVVFSGSINLSMNRACNIEYLGYSGQDELISQFSSCDLLYCPYWLNESSKQLAMTSFPSKVSTYLASGVPVLFHGPNHSAPSIFLEKNKSAFLCDSLKPEVFLDLLEDIIRKPLDRRQVAVNGHSAIKKELTDDMLFHNFSELLK